MLTKLYFDFIWSSEPWICFIFKLRWRKDKTHAYKYAKSVWKLTGPSVLQELWAMSLVSSCYGAKRSISKSTKKSCCVCSAQCAKKERENGRKNRGCFIMTIDLLIKPSASGSSWQRRTSRCWNNLPIYLISRVTFSFPQVKGTRFECVDAIKRAVTTKLRGTQEKILPAVHRTILEKNGKVD